MSIRARALVTSVVLSSLVLAGCGSRVGDDGGSPQPTGGQSGGTQNTASDTGVTPTEIKIGVMAGLSSALGPDTFSASLYGARAFFEALNAEGGVNGRTIKLVECDDQGTAEGNNSCVRRLIDNEEVFALAGTTAFDYAGAQYVDSRGVPDVGGQPVSNFYDQYPHLYSIYGSGLGYPRDGRAIGFGGELYQTTENFRWFKERLGARVAGVVYYNVAPSQRYANAMREGLELEGYTVVMEEINLGLPNWDAAVLDMKSKGVQIVYDALDGGGNRNLCNAIQTQGLQMQAKVLTSQGWTDQAAELYGSTPACLNNLYALSQTRNYNDVGHPEIAKFREAVDKYVPDWSNKVSMWMLEGYISAKWLTDAIESCGADVTRACVEEFLNRDEPYDADGLLLPRNFAKVAEPPRTNRECLSVARWTGQSPLGRPGWTTQESMDTNCFDDLPVYGYPAG